MLIRIGNDFINTDQIAWAKYMPPQPQYNSSDEPTGHFYPCAIVIAFTNASSAETMQFTGDQAIKVRKMLMQLCDMEGE